MNYILLLYRLSIFVVTAMMVIVTSNQRNAHVLSMALFALCIYEILITVSFMQIMRQRSTRLLVSIADSLIAFMVIYSTGGIYSPFLFYCIIPLFTLHFIYRIKGLLIGVMAFLIASSVALITSRGSGLVLYSHIMNLSLVLIVNGLGLITLYVLPFIALKKYYNTSAINHKLKKECKQLQDFNLRFLLLSEIIGKLSVDHPTGHVMDKLVKLCINIFEAGRASIFLLRKGEVEIYGAPTIEEKESSYRLIMDNRKLNKKPVELDFSYDKETTMIPLVRGKQLEGVLSIHGRDNSNISKDDAVFLTMISNIISTYLENVEYIDSQTNMQHNKNGVSMNQLESGKQVIGMLDQRIKGI